MSKKKNQKPVKTVSSPKITENQSCISNAREIEKDRSKRLELVRIGHQQNNEWKQSNDDRQWW